MPNSKSHLDTLGMQETQTSRLDKADTWLTLFRVSFVERFRNLHRQFLHSLDRIGCPLKFSSLYMYSCMELAQKSRCSTWPRVYDKRDLQGNNSQVPLN